MRNFFYISVCFNLFAMLFTSSCTALKKDLYPYKYCTEEKCNKKRTENSLFCTRHHQIKMTLLFEVADKIKKESIEEEKKYFENEHLDR